MKYYQNLVFNTLFHLLFAVSALTLNACGGSTSQVADNKINHPSFLRSKVTQSPSYSPSGRIPPQIHPTFYWKAIPNAEQYRFGHENAADANEWYLYSASVKQAGCQNTGETCKYTPLDYDFPMNVEKVWWVQARVNGDWQDWSRPITFTIIDKDENTEIPTLIAPKGNVSTATLEFSWTSVNDATEYMLGYEDENTSEGWQQHTITASDAICLVNKTCAYTSTKLNLAEGQVMVWWVKAKRSGVWGDWSESASFTVNQSQAERPLILRINSHGVICGPNGQTCGAYEFRINTKGTGYNYNVDCNSDGLFEATGLSGSYTCRYNTKEEFRVTISGVFPQIYRQIHNGYLVVEQWGTQKWRSMESAFADARNFNITATDVPDLTNVTSMKNMFSGTDKGKSVSFSGDISNWNVSNITDMSGMFYQSLFNQDISNWNVSNVTNMNRMFSWNKLFNQDISQWNVSNVTNMKGLFSGTKAFQQDISQWNVGNVTDMSSMFNYSSFNQDISNWNVSKVVNMSDMFSGNKNFNQDIANWDVSSVTEMQRLFGGNRDFNQDIGQWDVSKVTNMSSMFARSIFNQDISQWDVSRVTEMAHMFNNSSFNQDINQWNVSKVTNMNSLFSSSAFNQDISNWDVSKVTNMSRMFYKSIFNQDIGNWDISKVRNMEYMFYAGKLSTDNYDKLLNGWSILNLRSGVSFSAGNAKYSTSALGSRERIITDFAWKITDGGEL